MIVAIDDAGNVSDTATVTGKNCLSFNVPNVFTPEMVDLKNDVLTLYTAGNSDETNCSRFIKNVTFSIFNRWGEEIFKKVVSPDIDPVFWNGSTGVDEEMPNGVYFYLAQVEFETIDTDDKFQTFKGWVHLIR